MTTIVDIRAMFRGVIDIIFFYIKLKIIFKCNCRLNIVLHLKDSLENKINTGIMYCCTSTTLILTQINTCWSLAFQKSR